VDNHPAVSIPHVVSSVPLADYIQPSAFERNNETAPGSPAVLISEGDAFLIMHLWELYPGLGHQLSHVVRTLRRYAITPEQLEEGSWRANGASGLCPRLLSIVRTEVRIMATITDGLVFELHEGK
jgi:hypothetical protein